jgi:hypothetical protein
MKTGENAPHPSQGSFHRGPKTMTSVAVLIVMTVVLVLVTNASNESNAPGTAVPTTPQTNEKPRAGHSDYLVGLTRKSLREGVGKDSVPVLEPVKGPGRDVVAKRLIALAAAKDSPFGARLGSKGLRPTRADDRNTAFASPSSSLKISADGTKLRFRANLDNPQVAPRGTQTISKDELEKIGRRFVGNALREVVQLGAEESLVFLGAKYLREESLKSDGKQRNTEVVASIAVFGREVRGVPVIGSGSKVAVWFANDRQPVGFDVDWAAYRVLRTRQAVLAPNRLFERVRATTVPATGTAQAAVSRFECGYIDLGATRRGAGIQSGCAIHYSGRHDDGTPWARIEYVPAGETVLPDAKWPLARLIAEGKSVNTGSPEYISYASSKRAPGSAPATTGTVRPRARRTTAVAR